MTTGTGALRGWRALPGVSSLWFAALRHRNNLPHRRPSLVQPGIFLGGLPSHGRWQQLRAKGVTRAISLISEAPLDSWMSDAERVLRLPVPDTHAPSQEQMVEGCAFLDAARAAGAGVFVFCGSGIGRAPTLYLAWWMRWQDTSVALALLHLRRVRPVATLTRAQHDALARWSQLA